MDAREIETRIGELLAEKQVVYTTTYVGPTKRDDWECDAWKVSFGRGGLAVEHFDFYTGLGHRTPAPETREDRGPMSARYARQVADDRLKRGKPVIPKAASVLHSLVLDADAIGQSFNDWAGDLGYDTDSRKALETFLACQENGVKLRRILGDLTSFREALEDY